MESVLINRYKPKYNVAKKYDWDGINLPEPQWIIYRNIDKLNIQKLLRENDDLKKENELLQKQITLDCQYCQYKRKYPELFLPMGSEGSLKMNVWTNPDESYLARYTVTIFGDLRDYEDPQKVVDWFKDKVMNSHLFIRQAVITAECLADVVTWTYEG